MFYMEARYPFKPGVVYMSPERDKTRNYYLFESSILELESFYAYTFIYYGKFGSGISRKHETRDNKFLSKLIIAPDIVQVLYGK